VTCCISAFGLGHIPFPLAQKAMTPYIIVLWTEAYKKAKL
jgi:hypothetical protein